MSGRTPDSLLFRGEQYAILTKSPYEGLFDPHHFGITPDFLHTGAYHGFVCEYAVADDALLLSSLEISAKDRLYPLMNETRPSFPDFFGEGLEAQESYFYTQNATKNAIGRIAWHINAQAIYNNVEMPMLYTGTLRIGKDADGKYYIGFIPGWLDWMHREVHDLKFLNGHLESVTDLSEEMAELRAQQPTAEEYNASKLRPGS